MKTPIKTLDGTGTEASETSGPAGVGNLATQVVISSSVNVSWESDRTYTDSIDMVATNGHCYEAPLRLRGGGDNEDIDMPNAAGTSGGMGGKKRGPPSPGSPSGQSVKQLKAAAKQPGEFDELISWLEQTVVQEKEKRKIAKEVAENMLSKLSRLRALTRTLTHKNSRLAGEVKGKDEALQQSLTMFIEKLDAKNAKTSGLRVELDALKAAKAAPCPAPS